MEGKMKRLVLLLLILIFMVCSVFADDSMGVKMISNNSKSSSTVSLDDLQLNVDVTIDGYGILKATSFEFFDWLGYYNEGQTNFKSNGRHTTGLEADFAMLRIDITNRMTKPKDFLENVKVKVIFEDFYEYEGWYRQFNYDNGYGDDWGTGFFDSAIDRNKQNTKWVINKKDQFQIKPMYTGHYVFGCTLPNAIIESKGPLRMEITMDGNVITYNIRK